MEMHSYLEKKEALLNKAAQSASSVIRQIIESNLSISYQFDIVDQSNKSGGLTKFGGLPYAPVSFKWPEGIAGLAPVFAGQIDIGELVDAPFPDMGILYLFAQEDREKQKRYINHFKVVYCPYAIEMQEVPLPKSLEEYGTYFEEWVNIKPILSLPDIYEFVIPNYPSMSDEAEEEYEDLQSEIEVTSGMRLLGHPKILQGCVFREGISEINAESEFTAEELVPEKWQLLFEIDFDHPEWGYYLKELTILDDGFNRHADGRYYVIILKDDLKRMDFSRVRTVYQMT